VGKKLKRAYSRGLEEYVLLIIGADPNRKWVNEDRVHHYQVEKKTAGLATSSEIKKNLDKFGIKWSKTSLGRKLEALREKDLVSYGVKSWIHVITQKGLKELERKELELFGKGFLNTYGSEEFSSMYWVKVEEGDVKTIDMYVRFKDEKFIKEFKENVEKNIKSIDFKGYLEGNQSFVFSDPNESVFQQLMQAFLYIVYSGPGDQIRFIQDLGVSDELLREVFDNYERS